MSETKTTIRNMAGKILFEAAVDTVAKQAEFQARFTTEHKP